jgi:hypothetical protein
MMYAEFLFSPSGISMVNIGPCNQWFPLLRLSGSKNYYTMNATSKNGDLWTGERDGEWWHYRDTNGKEYQSREVPAYRIKMDNATQITTPDGQRGIAPLSLLK